MALDSREPVLEPGSEAAPVVEPIIPCVVGYGVVNFHGSVARGRGEVINPALDYDEADDEEAFAMLLMALA